MTSTRPPKAFRDTFELDGALEWNDGQNEIADVSELRIHFTLTVWQDIRSL
jgi:hypothetical protein